MSQIKLNSTGMSKISAGGPVKPQVAVTKKQQEPSTMYGLDLDLLKQLGIEESAKPAPPKREEKKEPEVDFEEIRRQYSMQVPGGKATSKLRGRCRDYANE